MNAVSSLPDSITECGLPGIRDVPYGVHMLHVYRNRDELLSALASYFDAGLRLNERCLWVSSKPLTMADARRALSAKLDVDAAAASGQLSLFDESTFFPGSKGRNGHEACTLWLDEEEKALAAGYRGLRIAGNADFVTPEGWSAFMDYEEACDHAFRGRRIVALCCYGRQDRGAAEIFELIHRHSCALEHPDEGWQITTRGLPKEA